jgi:hypothetical protein
MEPPIGFEPMPDAYKASALPAELQGRSVLGAIRTRTAHLLKVVPPAFGLRGRRAPNRDRTDDLRYTSAPLCRLSYRGGCQVPLPRPLHVGRGTPAPGREGAGRGTASAHCGGRDRDGGLGRALHGVRAGPARLGSRGRPGRVGGVPGHLLGTAAVLRCPPWTRTTTTPGPEPGALPIRPAGIV